MKAAAQNIGTRILTISPLAEINYQRTYSPTTLIMMFFTFSGIGWVWEVILHIIEDGMIINRGVLTGPWLPIYGAGGVLILMLLKKWREQPFKVFGMIILLCGVMEYVTSAALETLFGIRWWDYSDMLLHIQGRVCIEGLLVFGIGGLFIIYVVAPKLDDFFSKMAKRTSLALNTILVLVFAADVIRSFIISPNMGFGITF